MTNGVFRIKIKCENCGYKGSKEFPEKTVVNDNKNGVEIVSLKDDESGSLICPICKLEEYLTVIRRDPKYWGD